METHEATDVTKGREVANSGGLDAGGRSTCPLDSRALGVEHEDVTGFVGIPRHEVRSVGGECDVPAVPGDGGRPTVVIGEDASQAHADLLLGRRLTVEQIHVILAVAGGDDVRGVGRKRDESTVRRNRRALYRREGVVPFQRTRLQIIDKGIDGRRFGSSKSERCSRFVILFWVPARDLSSDIGEKGLSKYDFR